MQRIVHITVVLVNILWVAFFLTPDPLAVFVQRRSTSSSDEETLVREFCLQPPSDVMWTPTLGPVSVHADMTSTTSDVHAAPKTAAAEPPSPDLHEGPPAAPTVQTLTSSEVTSVSDLISSSTSEAAPVTATTSPTAPVRQKDKQDPRSHIHAAPKTAAAEPPSPSSTVGDLREAPPAAPPVKTLSSSELIPSRISKAAPVKPIDCRVRLRNKQGRRRHISRVPDDCCLSFYPRPLHRNLIRSYYITDDHCTKPGAVFITRECRHICIDPRLPWAVDIINNLDKKSF